MNLFSVENIAFTTLGYPVSYIELVGTLFGLISVYYASQANILTWSTGIINEVALFLLFYQVQLYADMFLQVYFFIVTLYGWRQWQADTAQINISLLPARDRWITLLLMTTGTLLIGLFVSNVHSLLPVWFPKPAAYPFTDSLVMTGSILATVLLARKKIENWLLWIMVDIVCMVLYSIKGIMFMAVEYLVFLGLASYGFIQWRNKLKHG